MDPDTIKKRKGTFQMSKTNRKIESRLAGGVKELAPDDPGRILSFPAEEATGREEYLSGLIPKRRPGRTLYRYIAAAACLVMLLTVGYRFQFSACYAVGLDANPSLTLTLNRMERVLSVAANNEDGLAVLEELSLERETCDRAVERILDRMLELGYLREGQGQVLLSVQQMEGRNGEAIRSRLSQEADRVLGGALEEHGVFSRLAGPEEGDVRAAREYGITQGKAELAGKLSGDYPDLEEGQLARMSIEEMMDLLVEKEVDLSRYGSYTGTPRGGVQSQPALETEAGDPDAGTGSSLPASDKENRTETDPLPGNGDTPIGLPAAGTGEKDGEEAFPDEKPAQMEREKDAPLPQTGQDEGPSGLPDGEENLPSQGMDPAAERNRH